MSPRLLNISLNDPRRAEGFILTQLQALRGKGWEVSALYGAGRGEGGMPDPDIEFSSVKLDAIKTPISVAERAMKIAQTAVRGNSEQALPAELSRWRAAIEAAQPDLILVQFGPMAGRLLPILKMCGRPWAVQFHGYDLTERCRHWGYRKTLATVTRASAAAFTPSLFLAGELARFLPARDRNKIHLITPGYDERVFFPRARAKADCLPLEVISVARLVPVKGHDLAIRAAARAGQNVRLTIVGEGDERPKLERLIAEEGVADRVSLAGELSATAIAELMARADVFTMLSRTSVSGAREGLGLAPIEAAASGLPVVVSDSGGLGETCCDGETGFVTPENDVAAAAAALMTLAADRERAHLMGRAGASWAAAKYASGVQATRADAILRAALTDR